MRVRAVALGLVLLAACTSSGGRSPVPRPSGLSAADWGADLDAFVSGLERVHPNPYWREPRADFRRRVDALRTSLPTMTTPQARIALVELAALIDGHTAVYPTDLGFTYYAIRLYEFADGIHVIGLPSRKEAVGGTLVGIGGVDVREAMRRVTPLVSHDNDQTVRERRPLNLVNVESLAGTGLVTDAAHPSFRVRTAAGTELTIDPPVVSWEAYQQFMGGFPLGLPHRADPIWSKEVAPGVLYVQYNAVEAGVVGDTAAAITAYARRPGFRRVALDVRHNGGGDNRTYGPLLDALRAPALRRHLSVVVGRATFSAAMNFVNDLASATSATFVGEPTGGRPSFYGDVSDVVLPHSGIVVHVSSRYWPSPVAGDKRAALVPGVAAALTSADWLAGRDPVLDAAL
jgi:hypothetical protein